MLGRRRRASTAAAGGPPTHDSFTSQVTAVLLEAQVRALGLGRTQAAPDDLLAILTTPPVRRPAQRVLDAAQLRASDVHAAAVAASPTLSPDSSEDRLLSRDSVRALTAAQREALRSGRSEVGTAALTAGVLLTQGVETDRALLDAALDTDEETVDDGPV